MMRLNTKILFTALILATAVIAQMPVECDVGCQNCAYNGGLPYCLNCQEMPTTTDGHCNPNVDISKENCLLTSYQGGCEICKEGYVRGTIDNDSATNYCYPMVVKRAWFILRAQSSTNMKFQNPIPFICKGGYPVVKSWLNENGVSQQVQNNYCDDSLKQNLITKTFNDVKDSLLNMIGQLPQPKCIWGMLNDNPDIKKCFKCENGYVSNFGKCSFK